MDLEKTARRATNRPVTTLFMPISVEGKISTGAPDDLDVERDFPEIDGLKLAPVEKGRFRLIKRRY